MRNGVLSKYDSVTYWPYIFISIQSSLDKVYISAYQKYI